MTEIETKKLADLVPDSQNANRGTERGRAMLESSLRQWGAGRSILLDKEGRIIAGNKTAEEAGQIGLDDVVIVRTNGQQLVAVLREDLDLADDATGARELAYADNRVGQVSLDWEPEQILADLDSGLDLAQFWNEGELNAILAGLNTEPKPDPGPQIDKAEQLQEKWQVKAGDIFQLGRHRLICGDCRDIEVVRAVCDGRQVNGVFTSPPYAEQRKKQYGGIPTTEYVEWWEAVQRNVREVLAGDRSFFVNIKPHCEDGQRVLYVFDLVIAMVREWGWRFVDELCWIRRAYPGDYKDRFKNGFEPLYHFGNGNNLKFNPQNVLKELEASTQADKRKATYQEHIRNGKIKPETNSPFDSSVAMMPYGWEDGVRPDNVIKAHLAVSNIPQAAQFPLALPTFFIKAYSDPDDIWLDPFAGSGTTLIACENEGRIGRGIEILPKYCAVAIQRWADLTGQEPALL